MFPSLISQDCILPLPRLVIDAFALITVVLELFSVDSFKNLQQSLLLVTVGEM